jgi:hypothetical protein
LKNWKTTSAYFVAAIGFICSHGGQIVTILAAHGGQVTAVIPTRYQGLWIAITAVAIAIGGLCTKDAGTPPTPPAVGSASA